jgi:Transmembrane protein 43
MSYTETTTTSWFTRLKNGVIGTLIGIVVILAAIYFLFTNEGRAINTYRALVEGAGLVVSVDANSVDSANDGKLVHVSGPISVQSDVSDPDFGVAAPGAVGVVRQVEMYQWVEKSESKSEKNVGGSETTTTTYSYEKEWKASPVDSSDFKQQGHDNPAFAVEGARSVVDQADLGAFRITGDEAADLGDSSKIALTAEDAERIGANIATSSPAKLNQGGLYIGYSATSPQVGDMRVTFERIDLKEASFVGRQDGDTIQPYTTSNGREIFLSEAGRQDATAMFDHAQTENTVITWIIRAAGLIGLLIGFNLLFGLFSIIADLLPFVGSIIGFGTGVIALILTLIIGPTVIAIGWFAYRPLLALAIIGGGVALAFGIGYLRRKSTAPAQESFGRA